MPPIDGDDEESRPETFVFLGFVHICGESRKDKSRGATESHGEADAPDVAAGEGGVRWRMHAPVDGAGAVAGERGTWLLSLLRRPWQPGGAEGIPIVGDLAMVQAPDRRSQKNRLTMKRMLWLAKRWLPNPRIVHPNPLERLLVDPRQEPGAVVPHAGICAGGGW